MWFYLDQQFYTWNDHIIYQTSGDIFERKNEAGGVAINNYAETTGRNEDYSGKTRTVSISVCCSSIFIYGHPKYNL